MYCNAKQRTPEYILFETHWKNNDVFHENGYCKLLKYRKDILCTIANQYTLLLCLGSKLYAAIPPSCPR